MRSLEGGVRTTAPTGPRRSPWPRAATALLALLSATLPAFAQDVLTDSDEVEEEAVPLVVPYGFYTETLGLGLGVGASLSGSPSPVSSMGGTLFGTTESSFLGAFRASDLPLGERLFLTGTAYHGRFPDVRIYEDGNPDFPDERAGSNRSSPGNFLEDRGRNFGLDLELVYVTPWGWRRQDPVPVFRLVEGLPSEEAIRRPRANPRASGDTRIGLEFFYRGLRLENRSEREIRTNGLRLYAEWDNRDFPPNPSRGSRLRLELTRDFGWFDSRDSWSFWEVEASKYVHLASAGKHLRQAVLALNLWTGSSPTWREETSGAGRTLSHRPPFNEGANLGGLFRMRSVASGRFNDRAVLYYSAELRLMPYWNPLRGKTLLEAFQLRWIQLVPFVELGRVAPEWDASRLHEDLYWDGGLDLRLWVSRTLVTLGVAAGDEEWAIKASVGHHF